MIDDIEIGVVDLIEVNAQVDATEDHERMALHVGVGTSIPVLAGWLLAQPDAYPHIGSPARERSPGGFDGTLLRLPGRASELVESFWHQYAFHPIDRQRRHFVSHILLSVIDFLLLHELGHIVHCHQQILASRTTATQSGFPEVSPQHGSADAAARASLRRVLEIDADAFAAGILAGAPRLNGLEKYHRIAFGADAPPDWTWRKACVVWLTPYALFFQIMAMMEVDVGLTEPLRSHPHPDVRLHGFAEAAGPQWLRVLPDAAYRAALGEALDCSRDLVRLGLLPNAPSRDLADYAGFQDSVAELRAGRSAMQEEINGRTIRRWERLKA